MKNGLISFLSQIFLDFKKFFLDSYRLYFLILSLVYFYIFILNILLSITGQKPESDLQQFLNDYGVFNFFITSTFLAPLYEELIFRSWHIFNFKKLLPQNYNKEEIKLIRPLFGFNFLNKPNFNYQDLFRFLGYPIILISSVLFSLVHISNYSSSLSDLFIFLIVFLLVIPQLIFGFFFAYIRNRYNLFMAWFWHGMHNFIQSLQILLATGLLFDKIMPANFNQLVTITFGGTILFLQIKSIFWFFSHRNFFKKI